MRAKLSDAMALVIAVVGLVSSVLTAFVTAWYSYKSDRLESEAVDRMAKEEDDAKG